MDTEQLQVLMVCGSRQRRSANRALLDVVAAGLAGAVDVTWFDGLAAVPAFDPDHADDAHPALDEWRRAVVAADVVVVAVPEYAGGMAGALKNALDWLVGGGELYRKPVAVLSAGTSGGAHARRQTAQTLTWQGAYVIAELGVAAPRTKFDDDGHLTDVATREEITALAATVMAAATMATTELVHVAVEVLAELGLDADHVAPAERRALPLPMRAGLRRGLVEHDTHAEQANGAQLAEAVEDLDGPGGDGVQIGRR